jgi:hypothetical protein
MQILNGKRTPLILIVCVGILLGALYTTPEQVCPSWSVTVVESSGTPVAGTTVRRSCQDYSIAGSALETDAYTDNLGRAAFQEAVIRTHPMLRWPRNLFNLLSGGAHASYGRHAYVFAFGRDGRQGDDVEATGYLRDWKGAPPHMESRLVMKDQR